jgi:ZIP family zinc transporter
MRRPHHPPVSWQEEFQDRKQQYIPIDWLESFFRCYGTLYHISSETISSDKHQIFSSLYSMLPEAKNYLKKGGLSAKAATLTLMGCFLIGALGISIVSQILHQYIPHSVVDCDHEHGDEEEGKLDDEEVDHVHRPMLEQHNGLPQVDGHHESHAHRSYGTNSENFNPTPPARRPSLHNAISSKVSQLVIGSSSKKCCDEDGQCFGYSDTCGTECFRNVLTARPPRLHTTKSTGNLGVIRPSGAHRAQTAQGLHERQPLLQNVDETAPLQPTTSGPATMSNSIASLASTNGHMTHTNKAQDTDCASVHKHSRSSSPSPSSATSSTNSHIHASQHHHHVPTNVFLSIGLQTSTAIALHKIPEGFITYATNHANPTLGFSIFLALFIHNITEGFALALPLYLAINSRWKAMMWSALLGGVSQPLGAGVAALSFKIAGRSKGEDEMEDRVYGCMFAVTSGIMAMVSLQLLGESLDLTHNRRLCFVSAFCGMGILGLSSALTA